MKEHMQSCTEVHSVHKYTYTACTHTHTHTYGLPRVFESHSCAHLAAFDELHRLLHIHPAPVVEDIADAAGTVDKAHVTLLTTCCKAEAAGTVAVWGEVKGSSGERKEWEREGKGGGERGKGKAQRWRLLC